MQSLYLSTEIIKSLVDLKDSKTLTYVDAMMILCRDAKLAVPVKQTMTKPRSTSFTKRSYDFKLDYRWDAIIIDCPEPGQGTMQLLVGDPIIIDREYLVIPTCATGMEWLLAGTRRILRNQTISFRIVLASIDLHCLGLLQGHLAVLHCSVAPHIARVVLETLAAIAADALAILNAIQGLVSSTRVHRYYFFLLLECTKH